jgi:hypothetical protein
MRTHRTLVKMRLADSTRSPDSVTDGSADKLARAVVSGEYQAPGWDQPCPRLDLNGHSVCEHVASEHREDGVCAQCESSPAAWARPCAKPIPEPWRGLDPILQLRDREVRVTLRGRSQMVCGRLISADETVVKLAAIERPMRYAQNGGNVTRDEIENITLILESWR